MLFRRRQPENFWSRSRTLLWPRRSFTRSFHYMRKRILRLNATPHAIAAGVAAGIAASCTPFVGFHFLLAFAIAYCISGNMAAAALGTVVGNPLTFPFIWTLTYEIGQSFISDRAISGSAPQGIGKALAHMDFAAVWTPYVKPMLIGSVPVAIVSALLGYVVTLAMARSFQRHRARRILRRAEARLEEERERARSQKADAAKLDGSTAARS